MTTLSGLRRGPTVGVVRRSGPRLLAAAGWFLAIGLSIAGLLPLTSVPVMQDDFIDLLDGLARLRVDGPGTTLFTLLDLTVSSSFIVPLGGVLGFLQLLATNVVEAATPADVGQAWKLLRVLWPVLALCSASWALQAWLARTRIPLPASPFGWLAIYSALASVTIATIQIHAAWSNDPSVSYPVAGWATTALAFLYLGSLARLVETGGVRRSRLALTSALSLLVVLSYTLQAAAVVAAAVLLVGLAILPGRRRHAMRVALWAVAPAGTLYVIAQLARLTMPVTYQGTEPGDPDLFLSSWGPFIVSSLPLTTVHLARDLPEPETWATGRVLITVVASVVLMILALLLLRRPRRHGARATGGARPYPAWALAAGLAAYWLASAGLIAASARYQVELGGTVGRVHTFYVPGLICVSALLVMVIASVLQRWPRPTTLLVTVAIAVVATATSVVNARSEATLASWFALNDEYLAAVSGHVDDATTRCLLLDRLVHAQLPEYYRLGAAEDGQAYYRAVNGSPLCPDDASFAPAATLFVTGDTHGFERTPDGQRFWWMFGPRGTVLVQPAFGEGADGPLGFTLTAAPCNIGQTVQVSIEGVSRDLVLTDKPQFVAVRATGSGAGTATVDVTGSEDPCLVPGDSRQLTYQIGYAEAGRTYG